MKPPQKPVVNNRRVDGEMDRAEFAEGSDEKKPISRQPRMLTVNVPSGNGEDTSSPISLETRNRQPPPKKLPTETIRNSFIEDNYFSKTTFLSKMFCKTLL